jgi:hypothetical protein
MAALARGVFRGSRRRACRQKQRRLPGHQEKAGERGAEGFGECLQGIRIRMLQGFRFAMAASSHFLTNATMSWVGHFGFIMLH